MPPVAFSPPKYGQDIWHLHARPGISFYDKELIGIASQERGLKEEHFEKADEKNASVFLEGFGGCAAFLQIKRIAENQHLPENKARFYFFLVQIPDSPLLLPSQLSLISVKLSLSSLKLYK